MSRRPHLSLPYRPRLPRPLTAALAAALVTVAGCGGGTHAPRPTTQVAALGAATIAPTATTAPAVARVDPRAAALQAAMRHWMGRAAAMTGAYVVDLTTGTPLFALGADVGRAPASVEKIYTSVALLDELGPDARLHTKVLGAGSLGRGGMWHGDLYLRGAGDPTFGSEVFNRTWELGYGSTVSALVDQLRRRGITSVTGAVIADASLFDDRRGGPESGYAADTPDLGGQLSALTYNHGAAVGMSPEAFAARQLALSLRAAHVQLTIGPRTPTGVAPHDARTLAVVPSPRLSTMLRLMDVPSDDLYAELLTKQLGARFGGSGTTTAGAHVIAQELDVYGVHPTVVDGSGLSRANRSSPRQVVKLLQALADSPVGGVLAASLPVTGVNGTTIRIGRNTDAQGRCTAKTGTLDYVTNLAGYCSAPGGDRLAFAVFIDGPGNERGVELLSRIVADLVRLDPHHR